MRLYRSPALLVGAVLATAGMLAACDGFYDPEGRQRPDEGKGETVSGKGPDAEMNAPVSEGGLRVLTQYEYERSVRDLLGADIKISKLSQNKTVDGWTTVGAAQSAIVPSANDDFEVAALAIAKQAFAEAKREKLVGCTPTDAAGDACTKSFVEKAGRRFFRRPLTAEEVEQYVQLAAATGKDLGGPWAGAEMVLVSFLQSPNFLYRLDSTEPDPTAAGRFRYTSYSMASRLSYFLWGSAPDDELLDAADRGELATEEGARAQAARMAQSPKMEAGVLQFMNELLEVENIGRMEKKLPEATPALKAALQEQVARTVKDLVWDQGKSYLDLFDTREIFMSPELAPIYGVSAPGAAGFSKMTLDGSQGRLGLLGWAGIEAAHSYETKTSPTVRGIFVRQRLLCQKVNPPPPGVSQSQPTEVDGKPLSARQLAEARMNNDNCAGCHKPMDGVGLGLENFDALGRYRTKDGEFTIDPSGAVDGVAYKNAEELSKLIRNHPQLTTCGARSLFRFATGHMETAEDAAIIKETVEKFAAEGHRIKNMFGTFVATDAFRRPFVVSAGGK